MIRSRAFTLIEILVATTVFVVAMAMVTAITVSSIKAINRAMATKHLNETVRDFNETMSKEFRTASSVKKIPEPGVFGVTIVQGNSSKTLTINPTPNGDYKLKFGETGKALDDMLANDITITPIVGAGPDQVLQPNANDNSNLLWVNITFKSSKNNKVMQFYTAYACRNN